MLSSKIQEITKDWLVFDGNGVSATNPENLQSQKMDSLVWEAVFGLDEDKKSARYVIWETALFMGVISSSINNLYFARGKKEIASDFTVPAINLRGMAYDMARSIYSTAKKMNVRAVICEIARSEIEYTNQDPGEFAIVVLAGALREGWKGPVFIQGDHYQAKSDISGVPREGDIEKIRKLISDSVKAGFYNIDIDMSTLVDLEKSDISEQQLPNINYSLELANTVRDIEPDGMTVSLGGEIGHIGGRNSTVEDFTAFIEGFNKSFAGKTGLSKVSVQTGTHHGGVVLPDGKLAKVEVDFNVLKNISEVAQNNYGMGGAVQHGASTLPDEYYRHFPDSQTLEIHLATGFQNMMMDHPKFPKELLSGIYAWLDKEKIDEKKEGMTDEQFHYKLRKKAWGQFKKECWSIDEETRKQIRGSIEKRLSFLFENLRVTDKTEIIENIIEQKKIHKSLDEFDL